MASASPTPRPDGAERPADDTARQREASRPDDGSLAAQPAQDARPPLANFLRRP